MRGSMKKIRVWKVVLLTIVTFGIYTLFWFINRRSEMIKQYKQQVPHWLWLVLPSVAMMLALLPIVLIAVGLSASAVGGFMALLGFYFLGTLVALGISIWWMLKFGQGAAVVTNGKMPAGWTVAYWIFTGPFLASVLQYRFNRSAEPALLSKEAPQKPSRKFVVLSLVIFALVLVGSAVTSAASPKDFSGSVKELEQMDQQYQQAESLRAEYEACIDKLEADYPGELTTGNEAAYNQAYAGCEEIRVRQHKAADAYNQATK